MTKTTTKTVMKASLQDLERELWLRMREKGDIVWVTKEGKVIPIKDMSDSHLINTLRMLQQKEEQFERLEDYDPDIFL